ncbi:sensor histidine kinase [Deinococcus maricopensis]|uniref:histidine kinase n=1 Tax=Deinococcus maricopensis (strain DSM 21211 / LMG 22137 / NRRL B-23946 / LB-34) TaxID=709986 RepID=E8U6N9_DEIML|nr:ATP-binding protein [Deinococcus maricopensis]ADV66728.1 histidine kinase [Deinococcus maricopensis DSM 21211]
MHAAAPVPGPWLDALPQAVLLHEHGRVTHLNAAAVRLWGVPLERACGRPLMEVVRRHTLEALAERGGELELEASGRALKCMAVPGALIVDDVTDLRRREAELREAAAILSHEFRTPVAAIKGVLEALEYEMPMEMQRSFVRQGLAEAERLVRLVDDLAVGFRPTRARTQPLAESVARAERLLGADLAASSVRLTREGDALVRADPDKLLQVLLNLVENAARYGPRPGTVRVEARERGQWVEVAVLDDGPPIQDTEDLFRAHTRGKGATGNGSGMGLYIVRSIVQGWGGQAWAERRGSANAFAFTVPTA